jgi:peptidoglycan/xylan/chitin deacetylase (PgdA/CDA1 family)
MRPFLVCIHDATPAFASETRAIIRDLVPLVGRRLAFGVVPDWHGEWPLAAHAGYCRLIQESAEEVLLHGCFHDRRRGRGALTWLAEGSDEMNGLDTDETKRTLERGQETLADVFGRRARGFLAPAWQRGQVRRDTSERAGIEYALGFFTLESWAGRRVPLATWTWDCGRWRHLGHLGHAIGWLQQSSGSRVPSLAIHPRDVARRFWPGILRLTEKLLTNGYEPTTAARLLGAGGAEVGV